MNKLKRNQIFIQLKNSVHKIVEKRKKKYKIKIMPFKKVPK